MKFFFETETAETVAWAAKYADTTYACTVCRSNKTQETPVLVPSGAHYKVLCENGHVSNGMPPVEHHATTREAIEKELADAKAAAKVKRAGK